MQLKLNDAPIKTEVITIRTDRDPKSGELIGEPYITFGNGLFTPFGRVSAPTTSGTLSQLSLENQAKCAEISKLLTEIYFDPYFVGQIEGVEVVE